MATERRLIDANELEFEPDENCIANGVLIWGGRSGGKTMTTVLSALKVMIANAPTVDAVEVVRCKDCKHYKKVRSDSTDRMCFTPSGLCCVSEDDYCSRGERREANED